MRKEANLPTDRLIEKINDWQSLRDSVSACVAKDTNLREGHRSSLVFGKVEEILIIPLEKWKFVLKLRWKKGGGMLNRKIDSI